MPAGPAPRAYGAGEEGLRIANRGNRPPLRACGNREHGWQQLSRCAPLRGERLGRSVRRGLSPHPLRSRKLLPSVFHRDGNSFRYCPPCACVGADSGGNRYRCAVVKPLALAFGAPQLLHVCDCCPARANSGPPVCAPSRRAAKGEPACGSPSALPLRAAMTLAFGVSSRCAPPARGEGWASAPPSKPPVGAALPSPHSGALAASRPAMACRAAHATRLRIAKCAPPCVAGSPPPWRAVRAPRKREDPAAIAGRVSSLCAVIASAGCTARQILSSRHCAGNTAWGPGAERPGHHRRQGEALKNPPPYLA